jgi:hypothetical protein
MKKNRHPNRVAVLFLLLFCASAEYTGSTLPEYHAQDPTAPVVSERNLLASERFWPYQTALTKPWKSLPVGSLGVLIRVEPGDQARVDFGPRRPPRAAHRRDGPGRAEQRDSLGKGREGRAELSLCAAPRLLDPATAKIYPFEDAAKNQVFLCVFADPLARGVRSARQRARGAHRPGMMPMLFPQGRAGPTAR